MTTGPRSPSHCPAARRASRAAAGLAITKEMDGMTTARSSTTHEDTAAQASLEQAESWLTPERDGNRAAPIRGLPSTATIVGHPIHPMMIPYPIAFLTAVLATDAAARATR